MLSCNQKSVIVRNRRPGPHNSRSAGLPCAECVRARFAAPGVIAAGRRASMSGRIRTMPQALAESGARVVVVDALVPTHGGLRSNLAGARDIEVQIGDTRDQPLMRSLAEGADVVFSLAGQTSHLDSMQDPYSDLEHNCRGPVTVLEAERGVAPEARVVFASTRQLYGRPRYLPVDEAHPVNPVDVNGIHKAAGEEYHRLY